VVSGGSRHVAAGPEHLTDLLGPVISEAGLELESLRVGRAGRRSVLRVVVDSDHGVTLDDIALVSRAVAAEIDKIDAMGPTSYTLEVSSPGVDRPLTEPRHWRRAAGRLVRVSVAGGSVEPSPLNGARQASRNPSSSLTEEPGQRVIDGRVIGAGPSGVLIEIDGERREFGYAELGPGQVQVEFGKLAADGAASDQGDADLAGDVESDGH
jgi:ribosome maturation factor RimP